MTENKLAGHIMIIDDEDVVRFLLCDIIKEMGYAVTDFGDPIKAINFYEKNYSGIDLVIFDMTMPELNGRETFFLLKQINRDIKSLVLSGSDQNEDIEKVLKDGCLMHLKKPVKIQDLKSAVATALSQDISLGGMYSEMESLKNELNIPGANVGEALKNLDGNIELYLKMLDKFIINYSDAAEKMQDLFSKNEYENLFVFSHSMRSIAANLGFLKLEAVSGTIEKDCQNSNLNNLPENVLAFVSEITSLKDKIVLFMMNRNKSSNNNSGLVDSSQDVDIAIVIKHLNEMSELAKKHRPGQISDIFNEKLKNISCSDFGYIEKEELLKKMRRYDFEELVVFIEKIKTKLQDKTNEKAI